MNSNLKTPIPGIKVFLILFVLFCSSFLFSTSVQAQTPSPSSQGTTVQALVPGNYTLSLSGKTEPNAGITIVTLENQMLFSGSADPSGNFNFSGIPIPNEFTGFCIQVSSTDLLQQVELCFSFLAQNANIVFSSLYIPLNSQNGSFNAYGYGIPGEQVDLYFSGNDYITSSDNSGYFYFDIQGPVVSITESPATIQSAPQEQVSPVQSLTKAQDDPSEELRDRLSSLGFYLFLGALFILLLVILIVLYVFRGSIRKHLPKNIYSRLIRLIPFKRKLHHWWWIGY